VKEFSIRGRLQVEGCNNHQDMILKLFEELKKKGIRFVGETKEVNKDK
jgi:hypothetical protein